MAEMLGTYRGVVVANADPKHLNRVQLQVPQVLGRAVTDWAEPLTFYVRPPAVGETVWVQFEAGDIRLPIWSSPTLQPQTVPLTPVSTTWDGTQPPFDVTGSWVEFASSHFPYLTVDIPPSGKFALGINFGGANNTAENSSIWLGANLYDASTSALIRQLSVNDAARVGGNGSSGFAPTVAYQWITRGHVYSVQSFTQAKVTLRPMWFINNGDGTTAQYNYAKIWITPLPANDPLPVVR